MLKKRDKNHLLIVVHMCGIKYTQSMNYSVIRHPEGFNTIHCSSKLTKVCI